MKRYLCATLLMVVLIVLLVQPASAQTSPIDSFLQYLSQSADVESHTITSGKNFQGTQLCTLRVVMKPGKVLSTMYTKDPSLGYFGYAPNDAGKTEQLFKLPLDYCFPPGRSASESQESETAPAEGNPDAVEFRVPSPLQQLGNIVFILLLGLGVICLMLKSPKPVRVVVVVVVLVVVVVAAVSSLSV
jgi:hypothetical protein